MDEFSEFSGIPFESVNIATPEVLVGGLIGSMIIFYFTGLAISAVGRTAHEVVLEVRRQFSENPDIMTYRAKPDYNACVSLVTKAALQEMKFPALVCVLTPIIVGLIFRFVGEHTNRPLLGAEVLAAYLMFGTVTGILMAIFLDTTGGAWDNAKKYVELGNFGGKNSEAHKASIMAIQWVIHSRIQLVSSFCGVLATTHHLMTLFICSFLSLTYIFCFFYLLPRPELTCCDQATEYYNSSGGASIYCQG